MKKNITILGLMVLVLGSLAFISTAMIWWSDTRLTFDGNNSETSINFARSIAVDSVGRIHVVWTDNRTGNEQVYWKVSPNGGAVWSSDFRLSGHSLPSLHPSIVASGDYVYLVYFSYRTGNPDIWFKKFNVLNPSWGPDIQLTTNSDGQAYPSIAATAGGSYVHIVWIDNRDGEWEVYTKRSTNFGQTWEAEQRLSDTPYNSWTPTITAWGSYVHAFWADTRHSNNEPPEEEYYKRSTNGGVTWGNDTRLTFDSTNSWAPSAASFKSTVHLVWFDERDGNQDWDIFYKRSLDSGTTWEQDIVIVNSTTISARPSIAVSGDNVHVVWYDTRDGNEEIYYINSTDGGDTWGDETRLTFESHKSYYPNVAVSPDSSVHVVWTEDRDGNNEIYYKKATN